MWVLTRKFGCICHRFEGQLLISRGLLCSVLHQLRTCVNFKMKLPEVPLLVQNDGSVVPHIGIGTLESRGLKCEEAIKTAIDVGYRYIDTAFSYGNEVEIGKAIRDKINAGVVKREELFVVTKLACIHHECVEHACRLSLKNLGLDYVDLYLMQWPFGFVFDTDDNLFPRDCSRKLHFSTIDYADTWKSMEKLVDLCLTRSIGVSNFNSKQIKRLMESARIKPVQNQIEVHPAFLNEPLIECCKQYRIHITGHSPFASVNPATQTPKFLFDHFTLEIAKNHRKTPFQIVLRYLIERGVIPIPKSLNHVHIIDNIEIFNIKLTTSDHYYLQRYNSGLRTITFDAAKFSIQYPFYDLF